MQEPTCPVWLFALALTPDRSRQVLLLNEMSRSSTLSAGHLISIPGTLLKTKLTFTRDHRFSSRAECPCHKLHYIDGQARRSGIARMMARLDVGRTVLPNIVGRVFFEQAVHVGQDSLHPIDINFGSQ
eukprot:m.284488 g.284488  ORF g.284488 m.284488 type:complete len:128 (-) comp16198_c0_seq14:28-411(-)